MQRTTVWFWLLWCWLWLPTTTIAADGDSIRVTIRQLDSLFLQNNLLLLAQRFQIEAVKAQEIQAGLFNNPNLSWEVAAYSGGRGRILDLSPEGQTIVSIQQVLQTAGKRNKRIALATIETRLSELQFADLLRSLQFELRRHFFEIYFLTRTLRRYDNQIQTLRQTLNAFEEQYQKNNISLREIVRLKALLFELTNDRNNIQLEILDREQALRTLTATQQPFRLIISNGELERYRMPTMPLDSLQELAQANRPDLRFDETQQKHAQANYNLQKALAVPDVQIGALYDQAGSYQPHYFGVNVAMDLPLFNRNQGNIQTAQTLIKYYETVRQQNILKINNEVAIALEKVKQVEAVYTTLDKRMIEQFESLNAGAIVNFQKQNLSLLEFIDLFENYNESIREQNRLNAERILAYEQLNYVLGIRVF